MSSFKTPIILCSTLCSYCVEFVQKMQEKPDKFEKVIVITIDVDPVTGKRPQAYYDIQNILDWKIQSVPTVITENADSVLSGDDAFRWLANKLEPELAFRASNGVVNDEYSSIGENSCILTDNEIKNAAHFGSKRAVADSYDKLMQERQADMPKLERVPPRALSPPLKINY